MIHDEVLLKEKQGQESQKQSSLSFLTRVSAFFQNLVVVFQPKSSVPIHGTPKSKDEEKACVITKMMEEGTTSH